MTASLREYGKAAKSLLRGRGFTFIALLVLGICAASIEAVSQVSQAVLRPVAHALLKSREQCSHIDSIAPNRPPARTQAAMLPQPQESANASNTPAAGRGA